MRPLSFKWRRSDARNIQKTTSLSLLAICISLCVSGSLLWTNAMEGDRPHRSRSSELFLCFTARPSSSFSSIRLHSKSIQSPGRTDKFRDGSSSSSSLHTSLSRRLRHNGSLKGGQASPMFLTTSKKKGCAFDTPEPTSPKVTCIGQVRVKTKKQGKKIRVRSKKRGELNFRRSQEGKDQAAEEGRLGRRHQRCVWLPLGICKALRTFAADFNCFQPCGGRSSCGSSGVDREKGEEWNATTTTSTCGAVFARWLMALQEGEGEKRRGLQEQVALAVEDRGEKEEAEDAKRGGQCDEVLVEEDAPGRVCIPPKNALLLMRCRSEAFRMASYAQSFWDSPAPKDSEEVDDDDDDDEEDEEDEGKLDVEEAEEDYLGEANLELGEEQTVEIALENIACDEDELKGMEVETWNNVEQTRKEEEKTVEKFSATDLVEEPVTGKSSSLEFVEEPDTRQSSLPEYVEEQVVEDDSSPESMESEVEEKDPEDPTEEKEENGELQLQRSGQEGEEMEKEETQSPKTYEEEAEKEKTEGETSRLLQESDQSQVKDESNEEGRVCCSFSSPAASSVLSEQLATSTRKVRPSEEQTTAGVEEEKSTAETSSEGVGKEEDGKRADGGGDQERKEERDKSLPDCLSLMLCEPKLSIEVSKETWACSTDFQRWRPERKSKAATEGAADDRRRLSTDSNSAKPPLPPAKPNPAHTTTAPSMAAAVEQKLVNASAYEPFVLTRCKSEPMRSSAKLAPEACFWKSRKVQQHPVDVGAAGIGF